MEQHIADSYVICVHHLIWEISQVNSEQFYTYIEAVGNTARDLL
jgi:hypothetical protein